MRGAACRRVRTGPRGRGGQCGARRQKIPGRGGRGGPNTAQEGGLLVASNFFPPGGGGGRGDACELAPADLTHLQAAFPTDENVRDEEAAAKVLPTKGDVLPPAALDRLRLQERDFRRVDRDQVDGRDARLKSENRNCLYQLKLNQIVYF